MSTASLHLVPVPLPENTNVILGQSHFIKTCEDIYEACQSVGGGIKFGLAFSEASGDCLVRSEGTDDDLVKVAETFMYEKLRCGHTFAVWIRSPHFPINVLNAIKNVPEVCSIYAATANPLKVLVAEDPSDGARGIAGVIDGSPPKGIENEEDKKKRKDFLRMIGYKK